MASRETISVRGARVHNLQGVSVELPRERFVVFTGPSGSGKSSLAFDTLFAEGQRRYVESLSSYARQFLGQMDKPEVESISGLCPTISIEQRASSANPRSTVGTITEVYDYLRLLYAKLGTLVCPDSGLPVLARDAQTVATALLKEPEGTRLILLAPLVRDAPERVKTALNYARKQGYSRVRLDGEMHLLDDLGDEADASALDLVIDRLVLRPGQESRVIDSVETAYREGRGELIALFSDREELFSESPRSPSTGRVLPPLSAQLFSFNSPTGMCPDCNGMGSAMDVELERLIPDGNLSLREGAIVTWSGLGKEGLGEAILQGLSEAYGLELDIPYSQLSDAHKDMALYGVAGDFSVQYMDSHGNPKARKMQWEGAVPLLLRRLRDTRSSSMRTSYQHFLTSAKCGACGGMGLNDVARAVRFRTKAMGDLVDLPVDELCVFVEGVTWEEGEGSIGEPIVSELVSRLRFLVGVGLPYLTLSRRGNTLSGGESQRLRLASQLGSELTGILYVLDEPSIGLHPKDSVQLLEMLKRLRDQGNTVLVVEHDLAMIREADYMVEFGPGAGSEGGLIVAAGSPQEIKGNPASLTGQYLAGTKKISWEENPRVPTSWLIVHEPRANNLQGGTIRIPLGVFCGVSGVSGAGKSSLVNGIVFPALSRKLHRSTARVGDHKGLDGTDVLDKVIAIDQRPIGKSPRSNPATYTGAFAIIRELFSQTTEAKTYGYGPGRFSFNVKGGRCEACRGEGVKRVEMHFLPDVHVRCQDCDGARFNEATLRVTYRGFTIADVLALSVSAALEVFHAFPRLRQILETLQDVGLGYLSLGQASSTLSGGEAQRIKLARELSRRATGHTLYILDEPSTGLHLVDVERLLAVLQRLVGEGNSVLMIEHNVDMLKTTDWVVDMGPGGGSEGGYVVAEGTPREIAKNPDSITGQWLGGQSDT